jgi:hypothetical protein
MVQSGLPLGEATVLGDDGRRGRGRPSVELPEAFFDALYAEEERIDGSLSVYGIRKLYKSLYGKLLSSDKAQRLFDEINGA